MEETLHALGQLIVQSLPTFVLVLLLYLYLRAMFFKPIEGVLADRDEATAGARKKAAEALDRAQAKALAYEDQIRAARNEIYREQDAIRRKWNEEQSSQLEAARAKASLMVKEAKAEISKEAEQARAALAGNTQALAEQVTQSIMRGRAA